MTYRAKISVVGCLVMLLVVWTSSIGAVAAQDGNLPERDYWPTDEWRTSSPEDQRMDSEFLAQMFDYIDTAGIDIHGIVVVRHGYIVAEAYYEPYSQGMQHLQASVAKSLTSILVGMAMQQGYLESVDQRVVDLFPDRTIANLDERKSAMTLENLLTMTAGLRCRDGNDETVTQMIRRPDWVQFMLDLPMSRDPGTEFNYCNGVSHLLSAIVHEVTGMTALEFAREQLFSVIGIRRLTWERDPDGNPTGGWGLYMTPRDMARIGYLYLNEGNWDGNQLVSPAWVAASTSAHDVRTHYGYQWWVDSSNEFSAFGAGGQVIMVRPDYDLVVAITSDPLRENTGELTELVYRYILPAINHGEAETEAGPD